ncbi:hypothetical protein KSP40_PGU021054 [Platanthera guangdongensis]|uniref:Uncharacterized protein n=1 Tax=Platanthera guangdongensis TaxID=2320717 RepID=A0ABR2MER7_9ASPA
MELDEAAELKMVAQMRSLVEAQDPDAKLQIGRYEIRNQGHGEQILHLELDESNIFSKIIFFGKQSTQAGIKAILQAIQREDPSMEKTYQRMTTNDNTDLRRFFAVINGGSGGNGDVGVGFPEEKRGARLLRYIAGKNSG